MTVAELIVLLQQQPQDATVLMTVNEDWNKAKAIQTVADEHNPKKQLYYKGDSPIACGEKNFIIIKDYK